MEHLSFSMRESFSILGRFVDRVERWLYLSGVWLIIFLMLLVVADVAYRTFQQKSIPGEYELAELVMVGIILFTLAYTQNQRGHVRMEIVVIRLRGKTSHFVETAALLIVLAICSLIVYQSALEAKAAIDIRLFTMGVVQWPVWPVKIAVPVGFFLVCLRVGIQIIQQVRSLLAEGITHES